MENFINRIRAIQDQEKPQTRDGVIAFLERKIIAAAKRGDRSINLNDFYGTCSRRDLFNAYFAIGRKEGITISAYYVGEAGRAKHGDTYIHTINW